MCLLKIMDKSDLRREFRIPFETNITACVWITRRKFSNEIFQWSLSKMLDVMPYVCSTRISFVLWIKSHSIYNYIRHSKTIFASDTQIVMHNQYLHKNIREIPSVNFFTTKMMTCKVEQFGCSKKNWRQLLRPIW